jgi:hypothetical protein
MLELSLFDEVADALRGAVPPTVGPDPFRCRPRRWGIKVWFGPETPGREHYEAQVIGPHGVEGATVLALEVGFHAEHAKAADNEAVIARLMEGESKWRRTLGPEPVVGEFIGSEGGGAWRRISEAWPDPDLGAPDLAIELADRLADYLTALEPLRVSPRR